MKNVTNVGDHEWNWKIEFRYSLKSTIAIDAWTCKKCGLKKYSRNANLGGCAPIARQKAFTGETYTQVEEV